MVMVVVVMVVMVMVVMVVVVGERKSSLTSNLRVFTRIRGRSQLEVRLVHCWEASCVLIHVCSSTTVPSARDSAERERDGSLEGPLSKVSFHCSAPAVGSR